MSEEFLNQRIRFLKGVGEQKEKLFERLELRTVSELLRNYPRDYQDRSVITPVYELSDGDRTSVAVYITGAPTVARMGGKKTITRVKAADQTGSLTLVFFNQEYRAKALRKGDFYLVYGTVNCKYNARLMTPEALEPRDPEGTERGRIAPIYRATAGLSSAAIEKVVQTALADPRCSIPEILPDQIRARYDLMDREQAVRNVHHPAGAEELAAARKRLVFEELFCLACGLGILRRGQTVTAGLQIPPCDLAPFYAALPYTPTGAQRRSIAEAVEDMTAGKNPMNRLLQGDVGSGKTTVAAACVYLARMGGYQSAVMAPTEILAVQHAKTFSRLLGPLGVRVGLLCGQTPASEKRRMLAAAASGELDLLVGTHALLEDQVQFARLGLTVCDEQHRFGVRQRGALGGRGEIPPHSLVMSATPIPRTLALVIYGDMDISVLDELPPGRQVIKTYAVGESYRERIRAFIRRTVAQGQQVYIVCPLIEDEEGATDLKPVREYWEELSGKVFPELTVGLLHGRMKNAEKAAVMESFHRGQTQILVTTTVVEVGVDVPNATLMVIENAERFGLSQLHQLRGRVGRGSVQSYCILLSAGGEKAEKRLAALCRTNDGFEIAREDLALRGPGDFFGSRQHGIPAMHIASFSADMRVLHEAGEAAEALLKLDPALALPNHRPLAQEIRRFFSDTADGKLFLTL